MRKPSQWSKASKFCFRIALTCLRFIPKRKCQAFGLSNYKKELTISNIYVINLKRQPARWKQMKHELKHLTDRLGSELWNLTQRYNAIDAVNFLEQPVKDKELDPHYTLQDQLFVEPQPLTLPNQMFLDSPIHMSRSEIAVARSHIGVWHKIIKEGHKYVLILEDDVWFRYKFSKILNKAWAELSSESDLPNNFDILYLSYEEVKNGAPKTLLSKNLFRPTRGLWHLSGYVLSQKGAVKLINLLPCQGPIDLWINHRFEQLNVLALKKSIISQRPDFSSTNSYSILPTLTKIGAITSESAALFHVRPKEHPVFAFGSKDSGLSSLAMALLMLGYRCCSDLQTLPSCELENLCIGSNDRVFNAYVNVRFSLEEISSIKKHFPSAKFIITINNLENPDNHELHEAYGFKNYNTAFLQKDAHNKWKVICDFLKCAPPISPFPEMPEIGQRKIIQNVNRKSTSSLSIQQDKSPWVAEHSDNWQGIELALPDINIKSGAVAQNIESHLHTLDTRHWFIRDDTFTDNLALFRPSNIEFDSNVSAKLKVKKEALGVRNYSAASITSCNKYLYGRFETVFKASNHSGIITGFFLHRDSPRQEIDIEIAGNRTNRLLVNVFYNPGIEGTKFDYGYRGSPSYIDLGFDASQSYHRYVIEWKPGEIRWYVDGLLVHKRVEWQPTPIPHLSMSLHFNTWPSRSKKLAGRLKNRKLPATTFIKTIAINTNY